MNRLVHQSVRTFVALAEHGTLSSVGSVIGRTPSAVSLQIAALEQSLECQLFTRSSRGMRLSQAGAVLLQHAKTLIATEELAESALRSDVPPRDVRFGMPQDFASSRLASTLNRFRRGHPEIKVSAVIERNGVVSELMKSGQLDLALLISRAAQSHAVATVERASCWFASANFRRKRDRPLPLVLLNPPCVYREFALSALERESKPWEIAFSSDNVTAMWAAVAAGVGVTVRMDLGAPGSVQRVGAALGLPDLPPTYLSVVRSDRSRPSPSAALADLVGASLRRMAAQRGPARGVTKPK